MWQKEPCREETRLVPGNRVLQGAGTFTEKGRLSGTNVSLETSGRDPYTMKDTHRRRAHPTRQLQEKHSQGRADRYVPTGFGEVARATRPGPKP